ncbi:MAG: glycosyltransferase family 4 protein [Candidatus Hydrogenedens sp.]|jgi:glycosyltransferase involved in cell wall biosynthesis|nr:glycosyltransferase family 4 protein [Candidatus Hydrogenedens sp.]
MKFVFYACETRKIAAIRYRVNSFARLLEAEGHRCIVCVPAPVFLREKLYESSGRPGKFVYLLLVLIVRLFQLPHAFFADAVFFRGPLFPYGPPVLEWFITLINRRTIVDLDDAIWEPPAYVKSPFLRFMNFGWSAFMAKRCRHAVAGNALIRDYMEAHGCPALVIPTCIDMTLHSQKSYNNRVDRKIILGWTGLSDNLGYLDSIRPVLESLAERYPLELFVASGKEYAPRSPLSIRNEVWTLEREIDFLQEADIGLMPLEDTPRARGKCAFKALQYMGVGTPVVLSPVGMNSEVVRPGVTGYLAHTPDEWERALETLIRDAAKRESLGRAARSFVEEHYSIDAWFPAFRALLLEVARKEKS